MRGVWLENQSIRVRDDIPEPAAPGEAIVRVVRAGICNTDLELVRGYYPYTGVPGHEFVGTVEDVGATVRTVAKGDRVLVSGVIGCGVCAACRAGDVVVCLNAGTRVFGTTLDLAGGQAEAVAVPAANASVVKIPEGITTELSLIHI